MAQQDEKLKTQGEQIKCALSEIKELKSSIADLKNEKAWTDNIKILMPVIVTLIVAIGGWVITSQFNSSQLKITETNNLSNKEIAQINASLSFVKLMSEISKQDVQLRQYSKTIIAPALPPESSFFIAVEEVQSNPYVLEVLMRSYPETYWNYLVPYFENYPLYLNFDVFRKSTKDLPLFAFLDQKGLFNKLFQFLTSNNYNSSQRVFSFINYFDYLHEKEELSHNPVFKNKIRYLLLSTINNTTDVDLKADISLAASLVLDVYEGTGYGPYSILAAKYFWEKYDVSVGEIPRDGSVDNIVFLKRWGGKKESEDHYNRPAIDALSKSLFEKLSSLNLEVFDVVRIRVISYSYNERQGSPPYLKPEHSLEFMKQILNSLKTDIKKKEFSMYLGSLSGLNIYRSISKNKLIGKSYALTLIKWYHTNWKDGWHIPKFFGRVVHDYPELKIKIDKKWGVGTG